MSVNIFGADVMEGRTAEYEQNVLGMPNPNP